MKNIYGWERISHALEFYTTLCSYEYMDVPYFVGNFAYQATKPAGAKDLAVTAWDPVNKHFLVASGEQSFLSMMANGAVIEDAVCVTPCFRDEPVYDDTHLRHFMKVELISKTRTVPQVIDHALRFFSHYVPKSQLIIEKTDIGYDIVLDGYEIGSYGERDIGGFRWVYGTGLAEPRFTYAAYPATR